MQLPARIGKYELQEYLGGGMSQVFRARDTVIGRTVVVKILTEKGREDGEVKARFLAEARTAGNISHDNILGIYDFGEDEQHRPYIVMEYLRGEDLRHAIRNDNTGDLRNKLRIALQIGRALEYIHAQKIVHRDIKPENVYLTPSGQVKLMDFGVSKSEGLELTRTGYMVGTPYYMAPEQVTGGAVTAQADVYAFGVLVYELMTGVHPITGDTVERIFYAILNQPLELEKMREAGAPEALCQLVARCTAKAPSERPQGLGPVCAELERILAGQEPDPKDPAATLVMPERQPEAFPSPKAAPTPERRSWLSVAAGLAVVALAAGTWFAVSLRRSAEPIPARIVTPSGEMELVPAGVFLFGERKQAVLIPAYYIDKTEVTNAEYEKFCKETGHKLPEGFPRDKPDYPVVNVTIEDARAYAKWAGDRLPTAKEWEKAARGTDGRLYPWGNQPDPARANIGTEHVRPAGDLPAGQSPYGAMQMIGNVWQFIDEVVKPSAEAVKNLEHALTPAPTAAEPWYPIRGESFHYKQLDDHAIWDSAMVPGRMAAPDVGFRCVRDVPPAKTQ